MDDPPGNLMGQTLVGALVLDMGIQWIGWAVAVKLRTEKFYDFLGSITFISLALGSMLLAANYSPRQILVTTMVVLWALRLGTFLVVRILKDGQDKRFDEAKQNPFMFFVFWTIQGVWVYSTSLPFLLLNAQSDDDHNGLNWLDGAGAGVWAVGFLLETVADYEKFVFKEDPANRGRFIESGTWTYSRHPNYFGEMMLWWGILIASSSSLSGWKLGVAFLSPVVVTVLLMFVSGVPLLEKKADARWGDDPEYQATAQHAPSLAC